MQVAPFLHGLLTHSSMSGSAMMHAVNAMAGAIIAMAGVIIAMAGAIIIIPGATYVNRSNNFSLYNTESRWVQLL